jgi:hypothetical protein
LGRFTHHCIDRVSNLERLVAACVVISCRGFSNRRVLILETYVFWPTNSPNNQSMKVISTIVLLLSAVFLFAQSEPFGFQLPVQVIQEIPTSELATFNHDQLLLEDSRLEKAGGRTNIGRIIPINLNAESAGNWSTLPNGDRLWQYRFRSAGAKGMCVYFDGLYIPQGAVMFLYSSDRKTFVGPFTVEDCNAHGSFMMGEILGDDAVLEYYEPASVVGVPSIGIQSVSHMYRYVYNYSDYSTDDESRIDESDFCEVDVNCPEGADWIPQRDAVVRLLITDGASQGLCSGSVVNTTARDCRLYILTAMHCGVGVTDAEWLQCSVRFKYQKSGCGTGSAPTTSNRVGVFHLADSNDGGGQTGSDFLLLELEDNVLASYNVFYAGWDARTATPQDVVGIHHPAGDAKKISTATNVASGTYSAPGNHWRVIWMATETNHGVTEGGSSGSPIFNQDKRIVGQLTGGSSFCNSPTSPDYYGKMDKNWDDNPNTASQKLREWLDPLDTGELFIDGAYSDGSGSSLPCSPLSVSENQLSFAAVQIFPSLADDEITIRTADHEKISEYRVFSAQGVWVTSARVQSESETVNCSAWPAGVYFMTFIGVEGDHITQKFVVEHR